MRKDLQHTLKREVRIRGVGLHTGEKVSMRLLPAPEDAGVIFKRMDFDHPVVIPAISSNVIDTSLCTTIGVEVGNGIVGISTIEHLMAAFFGLGVDNVIVEVHGPEVPAMDGSAAPFYTLMKRVGLRRQSKAKKVLRVKRSVEVMDGDKGIRVEPCQDLIVDCLIDFDHPLIERQRFVSRIYQKTFEHYVVKARTFGFLREVEFLRKNGKALGGSLENAVVIGEEGVLNGEGLRFEDEFVRHKVLDLMGDLYLLGYPLVGRVVSKKSGHAMHHMLVTKLLAQKDAWELVEAGDRWSMPHIVLPSFQDRLDAPGPVAVNPA